MYYIFLLYWGFALTGLTVKLLNLQMVRMNRVVDSQSLQSLLTEAGASQVALSEHTFLDEMAPGVKNGCHVVVIPVADLDKLSINAIRYAKLLSGKIVAVHILLDPSDRDRMESQWKMQNLDIPLLILESPNGSLIGPLTTYVDGIRRHLKGSVVTIVLPVLVTLKWWHRYLHNQTARLIESYFQQEAGVATVRVPFLLETSEK
ncbi:MAG: hypothetical protein ACLPX5_01595 [Dissulfurispiraceae bacterium]